MNKKLSDITLEELWHLFPIQLISPQKEWRNVYTSMSTEVNRISLNKGYTENGFADEVFYVHIRYVGDNDELYFRDYLNEFVNIRKEYEKDMEGLTAFIGDVGGKDAVKEGLKFIIFSTIVLVIFQSIFFTLDFSAIFFTLD